MDLRCYLAMTGAEFQCASSIPPRIAWMACHFSCYGTGLSNPPQGIPPESMLIVNDRTPINGHDPAQILQQLEYWIRDYNICAVLLDFQRPDYQETAALTVHLTQQLACPVAVTPHYAANSTCPVFLPIPPPHVPLYRHIAPWEDREIWLEAALENQQFTITREGSCYQLLPYEPLEEPVFEDSVLHCKYRAHLEEDQVTFTLCRGADDLQKLLEDANHLGITRAIGLYQQLKDHSELLI